MFVYCRIDSTKQECIRTLAESDTNFFFSKIFITAGRETSFETSWAVFERSFCLKSCRKWNVLAEFWKRSPAEPLRSFLKALNKNNKWNKSLGKKERRRYGIQYCRVPKNGLPKNGQTWISSKNKNDPRLEKWVNRTTTQTTFAVGGIANFDTTPLRRDETLQPHSPSGMRRRVGLRAR